MRTSKECDGSPEKPKFGWAQSGNLTVYQHDAFVSMQADFEECDIFTVQFGVSGPSVVVPPGAAPPSTAPQNPILTTATIVWTIAGNSITRQISVANGATISGLAESVRVQVNDATLQTIPEAPAGPNFQYGVTIMVGRGVRPDTEQPPILQDVPKSTVYLIAQGTSQTVKVPQNVGIISVHLDVGTNPITPAAMQTEQVTVQQLKGSTVLKQYDPRLFEWVTLASSADAIKIANNYAGGGPAIVVTIDWGIDG